MRLARLTGGKAIGEGIGLQLKHVQISDLGRASKIIMLSARLAASMQTENPESVWVAHNMSHSAQYWIRR